MPKQCSKCSETQTPYCQTLTHEVRVPEKMARLGQEGVRTPRQGSQGFAGQFLLGQELKLKCPKPMSSLQ